MRVEAVDAETVRPLRAEVLRPGQPDEQLVFAGDEAPGTRHAGAFAEGRLVAVATVMRDPHPRRPEPDDWRLRGMATRASLRGRGIGGLLLARCIEHACARGGARLWCNARVGARTFYERAGFAVEGDVFEIAPIGPHHLMARSLRPAGRER